MNDRDIYSELRAPLMRFAASLVGPDEAEDIVSDAVVSTLRSRSLSSIENPRAYLMQAVLNTVRSRVRRRVRETSALARHGLPGNETQVVAGEWSAVTETVLRLPLQQRAAVYLVYWEDLAPTQAATLLGIRPATLRRYLHLAHQKLRVHLDE